MKTKRLFCFCLALVFMLGLLSVFSAVAEGSTSAETDSNLVVHYDFLGDTIEEQLRDKAPAGSTEDNLSFGNAGNLSRIENGVAYLHEAAGNYLHLTQASTDLTGAASMTFVTRFRFDGNTPSNLVDMVMMPNFLRWSIIANGTLSATFYSGSVGIGLGGGTVYTPGQWIDMALTVTYDAEAQTVTASRYVSVDGWRNYVPTTTTKTGCTVNPFSAIGSMTLGKNSPSIGDRGRSVAFDDFRIYNTVLDIEQIRTIETEQAPAADDFSHLENALITHYDFIGENESEQLRDKGTAGSTAENLTLSTTQTDGTDDSYIRDGVAYISHKANNYLRTTQIGDIQRLEDAMTVFIEFKASIDEPINVGDAMVITNTARLGYFYNTSNTEQRYLYAAAGKNNAGAGPTSTTDMPEGFENGWIRMAYILEYDRVAGSAVITILYSVDGGANWDSASRTAAQSDTVDLTTIFSGATDLVLGKVAYGIADRGVSFCYNDVRVYNRALTPEEVASIVPEDYRDYRETLAVHFDFIGSTQEEQLTDRISGSRITLASTTDEDGAALSYVENGVAYVNSAEGNYLFLQQLPEVTGADGSMTVFASFRPEGTVSTPRVITDILTISDTVRLGLYDTTLRPHVRLGEGLDVSHQHSGDAQTVLGQQVWMAAVLRDDGNGNVSAITYLSTDGGATWKTWAGCAFSDTSLHADGASMMLGKLSASYADYGVSFAFDDIRIYSSALTVDQLKTIQVYDSPEITHTDFRPEQDLSLYFDIPQSTAEQYDSVTVTAVCMGEETVLEPVGEVTINGEAYLRFRYSEISALMLEEQVTVTVNAERNGTVWHGVPVSRSVAEACYAAIRDGSSTAAVKTLGVDILNYGAMAQAYFSFQTDLPVNRFLTESELAFGSSGTPAAESITDLQHAVIDENAVMAEFRSAWVSLTNPMRQNFRIATLLDVDVQELTAVICDDAGSVLETVSLAQAAAGEDGTWSFGCPAVGTGPVCVTIWRNYGSDSAEAVSHTLRYSVESYAATKLESENTAMSELAAAMLRYLAMAQYVASGQTSV